MVPRALSPERVPPTSSGDGLRDLPSVVGRSERGVERLGLQKRGRGAVSRVEPKVRIQREVSYPATLGPCEGMRAEAPAPGGAGGSRTSGDGGSDADVALGAAAEGWSRGWVEGGVSGAAGEKQKVVADGVLLSEGNTAARRTALFPPHRAGAVVPVAAR